MTVQSKLDPAALIEQGRIALEDRNYAAAQDSFARALTEDPNNILALAGMGNVFFAQKASPEALRYYEKIIEVDPTNPVGYEIVADVKLASEQYDEAIKFYKKAIGLETKDGVSFEYSKLGQAYRLQGKPEEALAAYQKALETNPKNPEAYYGFALTYEAQ